MHKLSFAIAALGTTLSVVAQNCNGSPPASVLATRDSFAASFYYGNTTNNSYNLYFDVVAQSPVTITSMQATCYDQGVGNPVLPNQVGAQGVVNVYTCATTRSGNELITPATPNSPWTLLGSGLITVTAWPAESPIAFATPFVLPAGTFGVALEFLPTTSGPNPGSLHCLGVSPSTAPVVSDSFLTISNQGIQQTGWTSATPVGVNANTDINLKIAYTPDPQSALFTTLGEGCYFRPQSFYESFPEAPGNRDLSNTSIQLINLGANYLAAPGSTTFVTPTGTSLSAGAYGSSSSATWDDALSTPIVLPFAFPFPSGTTNDITISSNGFLFLAAVTNNTFDYCGAAYGSVAPFRDAPPRIAAFYHDLDVTVGGGIFYEVDPSTPPAWVRITWQNVQEWGVPAAVNTMQVTLYNGGNIDLVYGPVSNQSATNNALAGFSPGNGARLATPIDISASLPFQSGDGAIPPVLGMSARPVLGTTPNVVTSNITPGTLAQFFVAGLGGLATPVDLGFAGMPGCGLYLNQTQIVATLLSTIGPNNTFEVPFSIPNVPQFLQNVQFFFQAAPLTPGLNAAGILTSNGICAKIGL